MVKSGPIPTLGFPMYVYWNITSLCNLRCSHCLSRSGSMRPGELTHEQAMALVEEMIHHRAFYLYIAGGEPMLLEITLQETVIGLGLRRDESATRAELRLTANYVLTPPNNGRVIRGSVFSVVNYDVPEAAYGEITAQDDARERAAETMAQRFRAELALRMAQQRAEGAQR